MHQQSLGLQPEHHPTGGYRPETSRMSEGQGVQGSPPPASASTNDWYYEAKTELPPGGRKLNIFLQSSLGLC